MNTFESYAEYYDLLYGDKDYISESNYVLDLVAEHAPHAKSILELGCGTGAHAIEFANKNFTVDGIDISDEMLAYAKKRLLGLKNDVVTKVNFYNGDVRHWRSGRKYDVILSLFHVFSYQVSNEDLEAAFLTASEHLNPGGILIFDFWYGPGVLSQSPETRVKRFKNNSLKVTRIAEPVLFPSDNKVEVNYTILVDHDKDITNHSFYEKHNMRYLFIPEIKKLSSIYFNFETHLGWMTKKPPELSDWAAVVVLKKK